MDINKVIHKISLLHSTSVETPTDFNLAYEMVDNIDIDWTRTDLKIIDPSCGRGTFLLAILKKLTETGHDIKNAARMIYGYDRSNIQTKIARKALMLAVGSEVNIYCEDSLRKDWNMKFDVVIGNPPYNWSDGEKQRKNNRENLWTRFITMSFEKLVKEDGYVSMVVPKTWMSPSKDYGSTSIMQDYFKPNQVKLLNIDECSRHFNVGSSFSYFVVKIDQSKNANKTKVITNDSQFEIDLNDAAWKMGIPTVINDKVSSIVSKFFNPDRPKFEFLRQYDGMIHERSDSGMYKVFHTAASIGKTFSDEKSIHHNRKKVMISVSGKYAPYYDEGDCSPSGMVICLMLADNESLDNAKSVFENKLFKIMVDQLFRYNGWININTIKSLPKMDLTRSWSEDEIYEYFQLTGDEIDFIRNC